MLKNIWGVAYYFQTNVYLQYTVQAFSSENCHNYSIENIKIKQIKILRNNKSISILTALSRSN